LRILALVLLSCLFISLRGPSYSSQYQSLNPYEIPILDNAVFEQQLPFLSFAGLDQYVSFVHMFFANGTVTIELAENKLAFEFLPPFINYTRLLWSNDTYAHIRFFNSLESMDIFFRFSSSNGSKITIMGNILTSGMVKLYLLSGLPSFSNNRLVLGSRKSIGLDFSDVKGLTFSNGVLNMAVTGSFLIDPYSVAYLDSETLVYTTQRKAFYDNRSSIRWAILANTTSGGLYLYNSSDGMNFTQNSRITWGLVAGSAYSLRWSLNTTWYCYLVWVNYTKGSCVWFERIGISGSTISLGITRLVYNGTSNSFVVPDIEIASSGKVWVSFATTNSSGVQRSTLYVSSNPNNDGSGSWSALTSIMSVSGVSGAWIWSSLGKLSTNNDMTITYKLATYTYGSFKWYNTTSNTWSASPDTIFGTMSLTGNHISSVNWGNICFANFINQGGLSVDSYLHLRYWNRTSLTWSIVYNNTDLSVYDNFPSSASVNATTGDLWLMLKPYYNLGNATLRHAVYYARFYLSNNSFINVQWFNETKLTDPNSWSFNPWYYPSSDGLLALTYSIPWGGSGVEIRYYEENLSGVIVIPPDFSPIAPILFLGVLTGSIMVLGYRRRKTGD